MISAVIGYEDNQVSVHKAKAKYVGEKFNPGVYKATTIDGRLTIEMTEIKEIHKLFKSVETTKIIKVVNKFFTEEIHDKINKLGFIHKLGILLYGKQGTGKTSLMNYICQKMIEKKDAIIFLCNTQNNFSSSVNLAKEIREIQDNPIVFLADEFERYAKEAESAMKQFLDGNNSIDNMLVLASTNYLDQVPETIKNRPSRFKIVEEIKGIEDKQVMFHILEEISNKIHPSLFKEEEITEVFKDKDNITIDDIKHIALEKAVDIHIGGITKKTIGFGKNKSNEETAEEILKDYDEEWYNGKGEIKFITLEEKVYDPVNWKAFPAETSENLETDSNI